MGCGIIGGPSPFPPEEVPSKFKFHRFSWELCFDHVVYLATNLSHIHYEMVVELMLISVNPSIRIIPPPPTPKSGDFAFSTSVRKKSP